MSIEDKECSQCGEKKPLSDFYKQKINQCKVCRNAVISKWRLKNREKLLQQMRNNNKQWYRENKDRAKEKQSKYAKQNKSSVNAKEAQRRAMQLKLTPSWADKNEISMFYEVAEVLIRSGAKFHVDHIVPLQGRKVWGFHSQHNLQVIPAYKNMEKGNKHEAN